MVLSKRDVSHKLLVDFYLVSYLLFCFFYILRLSLLTDNSLVVYCYRLSELSCLVSSTLNFFFNKRIEPREMVFYFLLLFCTLIISLMMDDFQLLIFSFFLLGAKSISNDLILKASLLGCLSALLLVYMCSQVGIVENYQYSRKGFISSTANSFGFPYYSTFPNIVLWCSLSVLVLKGKKIKWFLLFTLFGINFLTYFFCLKRLPFYVFVISISLFILLVKFNVSKKMNISNSRFISFFASTIFLVCLFGWLYLMKSFDYQDVFIANINGVLENRISLASESYYLHGIEIFGSHFTMRGAPLPGQVMDYEYNFLDSGFAYALIVYGWFFTGFLAFIWGFLGFQFCKANDKARFVVFIAAIIFMSINNCSTQIVMIPIILSFADLYHKTPIKFMKKCKFI